MCVKSPAEIWDTFQLGSHALRGSDELNGRSSFLDIISGAINQSPVWLFGCLLIADPEIELDARSIFTLTDCGLCHYKDKRISDDE